jgi:hypothetical protein
MTKLHRLCLSVALSAATAVSATIACSPAPPSQVPDAPLNAAEAPPASASTYADIGGPGGEAPPATPAPTGEAFAPVGGTLGGAPWDLKGAGTIGAVQKDGTVLVILANYPVDCGTHAAAPGDRTIALLIPWEKGAKVDLGALKPKEASAVAVDDKKEQAAVKGWKPKGTVEVLAAPTRLNSSGRIKIDLTSGKTDAITAEIPVKFCAS